MTIEIRDASLEARIRKQLHATGSSSVEEVLLRLLEIATLLSSCRAVEGPHTPAVTPAPHGVSTTAPASRENSLRYGRQSQLPRDPSTALSLASRSPTPLRMTELGAGPPYRQK